MIDLAIRATVVSSWDFRLFESPREMSSRSKRKAKVMIARERMTSIKLKPFEKERSSFLGEDDFVEGKEFFNRNPRPISCPFKNQHGPIGFTRLTPLNEEEGTQGI